MLTVTLLPEAMKLIRQYMNTDPASPYLCSLIASKEGTEEAYREYQLALRYFNSQLVILKGEMCIRDRTYLKPFKNKKIDEANVMVFSSFRKSFSVGNCLN